MICEWVFDGASGASNYSAAFFINDDEWSPSPNVSDKVRMIGKEIDSLLEALRPQLPTAEHAPIDWVSLFLQTYRASYRHRTEALEGVRNVIAQIQTVPNAIDVRVPFYATVVCLDGVAQAHSRS
jgi:hypothetical protein